MTMDPSILGPLLKIFCRHKYSSHRELFLRVTALSHPVDGGSCLCLFPVPPRLLT